MRQAAEQAQPAGEALRIYLVVRVEAGEHEGGGGQAGFGAARRAADRGAGSRDEAVGQADQRLAIGGAVPRLDSGIGSSSCRETACLYVVSRGVAVSLKNK